MNYNFRDLFYTTKICSVILQAGNIRPVNHNIRVVGKTYNDQKLGVTFKIEFQQRMNADFETLYIIKFDKEEEIVQIQEFDEDEDDEDCYSFSTLITAAKKLPKYIRRLLDTMCMEYDPIELEKRRKDSMPNIEDIKRSVSVESVD